MSFFSPCGTASVAARARGGVSEQDLTARVPAGRVRRTSPAASRPPHLVVDPVLPPSGICEALRFLQQLGKLHGSQERGPVAEAPVLAHRDAMSPLLFSVLLCQPAGCERHRIFSRRRCPRWRTTMCSTVRATNSTSRNPRPAFPGPAASFRAHLAGDDCARVEQSDNAPHLRAAAGNERRPPPSTAGMLNVYSTLRGQASPKPVSTPPCPSKTPKAVPSLPMLAPQLEAGRRSRAATATRWSAAEHHVACGTAGEVAPGRRHLGLLAKSTTIPCHAMSCRPERRTSPCSDTRERPRPATHHTRSPTWPHARLSSGRLPARRCTVGSRPRRHWDLAPCSAA